MNLSQHFTVREFCYSATAVRLGIKNELPPGLVDSAKRVVNDICQPVREEFGVPYTISSGYRCLELNRALKSKDTSQHVLAEAVDIEVPGVSNKDLAEWIAEYCDFDQLILEFHEVTDPMSGWVHASVVAEEDNRFEILTITPNGNVIQGLPS